MKEREKVAIIAGAGGTLGLGFGAVFAEAGYRIAGLDISSDALRAFDEAVSAHGGKAFSIRCDLSDWLASGDAVARIGGNFGRIDVLINNATARTDPAFKGLEDCVHAEISRIMAVGPIAALGTMRAALPFLKTTGGVIINIGSAVGVAPQYGIGPYGMGKAATHLLTQSAALEWARYGVRVNGLLPLVKTAQSEQIRQQDPELSKSFLPPLGYEGDAAGDIGAVALFLAGDGGSYITGQNICVDGGFTLNRPRHTFRA